jgi:glycosyltransferase XagB
MNHVTHTSLSVIIPAYNESQRIGVTLADLKRYFSRKKELSYEIIVVSDGSTDSTADVVRSFATDFPGLRLIDNKENRGKGYAVKCGMLEARGDYRLFMDADNSVTIDAIEPFIEEMYKGKHDVTIGSIAFSFVPSIEHNGWHRRLFGSISKFLVRIVATPGIYDTQRGFKLFTKAAAEAIFPLQKIERFGFDIEILSIARLHRLSIKELPVVWDNPAGSKVHLKAYLDSFIELCKIYRNVLSGSYDPEYRRGGRRRKASLAVLILAEFPALFSRLMREVLTSQVHLDIKLFDEKLRKKYGEGLIYKGKKFLHFTKLHHNETALYTIVKAQKLILALGACLFAAALAIDWTLTLTIAVSGAAILYLADLSWNAFLIIRTLRENPALRFSREAASDMAIADLPRYTILCPLYKEWFITPQFLASLESIDYPSEKLEVILLLEEKDARTIRTVEKLLLPENYKKVIVPDSEPRTKSRALNCGLKHATGEYLVVYDADAMPEPDQLRKAVLAFRASSEDTACIQAKVGFYNADENALTKVFAAEHSIWFDLTLPGLRSLDAPMPLGGTSNHFKTEVLRSVAGWDSFNVSEDWDLGIRLSKKGFKVAILESTTFEEANSSLTSWYGQRSRWIKGYIQTYLVHMRDPKSFKGGLRDLFTFQVVVGLKIFSTFANPIFWVLALLYSLSKTWVGLPVEALLSPFALFIGAATFIWGNILYLVMFTIGYTKKALYRFAAYALFAPLYRLGMSGAAWKALYDLSKEPHRREKTAHLPRAAHVASPSAGAPAREKPMLEMPRTYGPDT